MEFPVVLDVAGLRLPVHVVLEATAYAAGLQAYRVLRRRAGDAVDDTARWTTIAAAAVGAALGSKLLFWLDDPAATWAHRGDAAWLLGGKTIVGGLLGGWAAVEAAKARMGVRRRTGDLYAAPLCLGIALGRVGCFLTGLEDRTYGVATSLPWGVDFGDGVTRHPTQLYESAFCLTLGAVLLRATRRPHAEGALFRAFVAAYLAWRLGVDFLKPRAPYARLSGIQWACVAGIAAVALTWRPRPAHPPAALEAARG